MPQARARVMEKMMRRMRGSWSRRRAMRASI
jgi:hypothetical protein